MYGMSRFAGSGSSLSSEETAYVRVVRQYNDEILQGGIRPNLAEALSEAASSMNDQVGVKAGKVGLEACQRERERERFLCNIVTVEKSNGVFSFPPTEHH